MGGQENGCKERNKAGIKASEGNGVGGPHPSAGVIWGMARQGTTFDTPDLSNLGETVFDRQLPSRPATFVNLAEYSLSKRHGRAGEWMQREE
jgi:hypothetical protein